MGLTSVHNDGRALAATTGLYLMIVGLAAAVFTIEVRMPLGFTPWLLYVVPLGLTYWARYLYAPLIVAALCTTLILLGYVLSPTGAAAPIALTNRVFGIVTFWILGVFILRHKLLGDRLSRLTDSLAAELADRTRDLGLAVSALQREVERRQQGEGAPAEAAGTDLAHHVSHVLTAESRRLQEQMTRYARLQAPEPETEERLDATRNELVQLGHRLEQLQRELLKNEDS